MQVVLFAVYIVIASGLYLYVYIDFASYEMTDVDIYIRSVMGFHLVFVCCCYLLDCAKRKLIVVFFLCVRKFNREVLFKCGELFHPC